MRYTFNSENTFTILIAINLLFSRNTFSRITVGHITLSITDMLNLHKKYILAYFSLAYGMCSHNLTRFVIDSLTLILSWTLNGIVVHSKLNAWHSMDFGNFNTTYYGPTYEYVMEFAKGVAGGAIAPPEFNLVGQTIHYAPPYF